MSARLKRNAVVAAMAVLVCGAVALNWQFSAKQGQEQVSQQAEETGTKILGEATLVSGEEETALEETAVYTGSDYFASHVLDNRTGDQVAVVHHQFGERMYSEQMYCLGMYYNEALIGVEVNYSTYPEMILEELGYPNLYVRQKLDTFTGAMVDAFGFETNKKSRQAIIDGLKDVTKSALETIHDFDTLGEMLTFVYNEDWKPQAEQGEHEADADADA